MILYISIRYSFPLQLHYTSTCQLLQCEASMCTCKQREKRNRTKLQLGEKFWLLIGVKKPSAGRRLPNPAMLRLMPCRRNIARSYANTTQFPKAYPSSKAAAILNQNGFHCCFCFHRPVVAEVAVTEEARSNIMAAWMAVTFCPLFLFSITSITYPWPTSVVQLYNNFEVHNLSLLSGLMGLSDNSWFSEELRIVRKEVVAAAQYRSSMDIRHCEEGC